MKTVRLLLAALSLATLAACGTQSVTGPDAPGAGARRDVTPAAPTSSTEEPSTQAADGTCEGTVVVTTDSSGNTVTTCTTEVRGPVFGSGG